MGANENNGTGKPRILHAWHGDQQLTFQGIVFLYFRFNFFHTKKVASFIGTARVENKIMVFLKKKIIFLLFVALLSGNSAQAKDLAPSVLRHDASFEKTQGGKVRVFLVEPQKAQGRNETQPISDYDGVIDIRLDEGWKTYWRNPGNSGMAPFFTFAQGNQYVIDYPAPQLLKTDGDWAFGYTGHVMLPFKVFNVSAGHLTGSLTIGICKSICIPVDVPFDFDLKNANGDGIIAAESWEKARISLPKPEDDNFQLTDVHIEKDVLILTLRHPAKDGVPELFLDGGTTELGIAEMISSEDDKTTYRAALLYHADDWDGRLFYTAKNDKSSVAGWVNVHIDN